MDELEIERLGDAWIALHLDHPSKEIRDSNWWSYGVLDELVSRQPSLAWSILLRMIDTAKNSSWVLENIAAGPLEDMMVRHGEEMISQVEDQAARNALFREVLSGVWKRNMKEDLWLRIQACLESSEL